MNQKKTYGYALCSSMGAGYYDDFAKVQESEQYVDDAQIKKYGSVEEAKAAALQCLHALNPGLKPEFNLLPNWFQRSYRFKDTDFVGNVPPYKSPFDL